MNPLGQPNYRTTVPRGATFDRPKVFTPASPKFGCKKRPPVNLAQSLQAQSLILSKFRQHALLEEPGDFSLHLLCPWKAYSLDLHQTVRKGQ